MGSLLGLRAPKMMFILEYLIVPRLLRTRLIIWHGDPSRTSSCPCADMRTPGCAVKSLVYVKSPPTGSGPPPLGGGIDGRSQQSG
jgi:hypothetical protein